MQVVIKIPEEVYERFGFEYREENLISKYTTDVILDAFCKGTTLPKGHGQLIDADSMWNAYHDLDYDFYEAFDSVDAIIEADKEKEVQE